MQFEYNRMAIQRNITTCWCDGYSILTWYWWPLKTVATLWQSHRTGWKITDFQQELYMYLYKSWVFHSTMSDFHRRLCLCHAPQQTFPWAGRPWYFPVNKGCNSHTVETPEIPLQTPPGKPGRIDSQIASGLRSSGTWSFRAFISFKFYRWVTHHDWKICNKTKTDRGPNKMPLLNTLNWIVDDLLSFWITCIQAVETWNSLYRFIAFWAHSHRLEVRSIF